MADDTSVDNPTDYGQIAKQQAAGFFDAGVFDAVQGVFQNGALYILQKGASFIFGALDALIILASQAVFAVLGELDPAFGTIASQVVSNMFDVPVNTSAFTNMYDPASRKEIGRAVGANLLTAFKGDQANVGAGELVPSTSAAENYLGIMANLAVEGWTFDVLGGFVPFIHLEHLGELNEIMAQVLGLGRMSRAVLRPFVNTLISTPALWSVNKQYRPKMLSVPEAIHAWYRGDVTEDTVNEIAARDGYGDDAIAALKNAERKRLTAEQLEIHYRAGGQDQDAYIAGLQALGYDRAAAIDYINAHEDRLFHDNKLARAQAYVASYADHRIDAPTFQKAIAIIGLDSTTLARVSQLAEDRRAANVPHLSESEIVTAVKRGVLNVTDYAAWLTARGYSDVDAVTKELVLQDELNEIANKAAARSLAAANRAAAAAAKQQAALAKRDQTAAAHAHWTGTLGEAERLVVRNVMPPTTYRQVLIDHGIAAGDADELVSVATADRDARAATLAKRASAQASGKTPALAIGTLTHAILLGARQLDDLIPAMLAAGFSQADAQLEHDLVSAELVQKSAAAAARAKTTPAGTSRALTLTQLERAVLSGATTIDAYRAAVIAAGYSVTDTATLVADLAVRLEARKFADERHALAEQRLAASHIPLATMEKAVVDGFQTLTDFQAYLAAHGFDASDQAILTDLLKLKLPAA